MDYNQIFYKNWETERYNWTIQIIPRDVSTLSTPTYTQLKSDAINIVDDLDSKFAKNLPIGPVIPESLKIELDLTFCPADLRTVIRNPVYFRGRSIGAGYHYRDIDLYNIFILSRQQKGTYNDPYDGDLPYPTVIKFVGAQKLQPKTKIKVDQDGMDYSLELVNIIQLALQMTKPEDVTYRMFYKASLTEYTTVLSDYAHNYYFYGAKTMVSQALYTSVNNVSYRAMWFKYSDLFDAINNLAGEIINTLLRGVGDGMLDEPQNWLNVVGNPFVALTYYKRELTYNAITALLHGRGDALALNDLYFVGGVYDSTLLEANIYYPYYHNFGFLIYNKEAVDTLYAGENPNMWDFYMSLTESKACQMKLDFGWTGNYYGCRMIIKKIAGTTIAPILDLNIQDSIKTPVEIDERDLLIATSTSNLVGMESDDHSEDSTTAEGTMSDDDYTFKSIVHNATQKVGNKNYLGINFPGYKITPSVQTGQLPESELFNMIIENSGFKLNRIYYKHSDSMTLTGIAGSVPCMMAVHESVDLDDGINTPTAYNALYESVGSVVITLDNVNQYLLPYQLEMNEGKAITAFLINLFSSISMSTCPLELDMDRMDIGTQYIGELYNFKPDVDRFKFAIDDPTWVGTLDYLAGKSILMSCTEKISTEEYSIKVLTLPELV